MSTYYSTNSNGNGYDNTGSYNIGPSGRIYDDTPLSMGGHDSSSSNYSNSSGPSDTSSVYNDAATSPIGAVRSPSYERTSQPQPSDDFNRGYNAGYDAAKRSLMGNRNGNNVSFADQENSSPSPRQTQVQHTQSMLYVDPIARSNGPTEKYQNQFAPAANSSRHTRSNMGPYNDDAYEHGGMPMNSSNLPSTGLTTTGIGAGRGSGRSGLGVGRQPGLANVNSVSHQLEQAVSRSRMGSRHLGSGNAMESKPGTGGWKGAAKRLARNLRNRN